jgi:integrase
MAARSGQRGSIVRNGRFWAVRFRIDIPGQFKRKKCYVRLCPVDGEGALSKTERQRLALDIIAKEGANSEKRFQQTEAESCTVTFQDQAETWLASVSTRKRKQIKLHTLRSWRSHLVWLNSKIGDTPLNAINNGACRRLVQEMHDANFTPKTMLNYLQVVKSVVRSLVTDDGDPVFPREWNHEFIDLPLIKNQHQPTLSKEEIAAILNSCGTKGNNANGWYRVLFSLLAGTGMRVGEALALEIRDIRFSNGGLVSVTKNLDGRTLVSTKTEAGEREIDLAPELAGLLRSHIGTRTSGFVFRTRSGGPVLQRNVLRMLHTILSRVNKPKLGFHAFRRFRVTHLRKNMVPEDLIKFWIGHAPKTVTDEYSKVKNDVDFRKEVADKVGLGFDLGQMDSSQMVTSVHNFSSAECLQSV